MSGAIIIPLKRLIKKTAVRLLGLLASLFCGLRKKEGMKGVIE